MARASGTAVSRFWHARSRAISVAVLLVLAVITIAPRLSRPVVWGPDSLFYQAQVYELRGYSESAALRKVFSEFVRPSAARSFPQFRNAAWVRYSARFYRRRWLVPVIAAALFPLVGADHALVDASVLGYIAAGVLLFGLLRMRFPDVLSLVIAGACLLLPPLRGWAAWPLTDTWGLALEIAALWAAVLALERGGRWIGLWIASMLVLSITRDSTIVLLAAVGGVALVTRTRRSAAVLATGFAASIPALVLFGAPLVQQLSWRLQGYHIPHPASWSYIAHHYPAMILHVLHQDLTYPGGLSLHLLWYAVGVLILVSLAYTLLASPPRDPFFMLIPGALVGAAVAVALGASNTQMRLELVFIPCVGVALAFTIRRLLGTAPATWASRVVGSRILA